MLKFKSSIRMVKKWDLNDFKHGLVVGQAGTGIIRYTPASPGFTETGPKREISS